ncbi:BrnT family toxin [Zwartia sp.]|uniref:BrnT family toxin n=1 Tax=Zwartia sp. TaxID=2978004 RepID=UPI002723507B|nr:BrnT family toxin [Zwartia sp.]MDO9023312.1 BrnT family toxin [Zwartia sp.]
MRIEFDPEKRSVTFEERGLDFERAIEIFEGLHFTAQDTRFEYEEERFITAGLLDTRLVVLVWTPRGEARRIISMRKGNDREKALYTRHLEGS